MRLCFSRGIFAARQILKMMYSLCGLRRWLNPDTSDNVVFIRRGKVCIVDPASKAVSHTHSHDEKTARSRKRCVNAETKRRPVELEEALQVNMRLLTFVEMCA